MFLEVCTYIKSLCSVYFRLLLSLQLLDSEKRCEADKRLNSYKREMHEYISNVDLIPK